MTKQGRYRLKASQPEIKDALSERSQRRQRALARAMRELAVNPRPDGCKKLRDGISVYHIKVDFDRITYQVLDDELEVKVLAIKATRIGVILSYLEGK